MTNTATAINVTCGVVALIMVALFVVGLATGQPIMSVTASAAFAGVGASWATALTTQRKKEAVR